MKSQEKHDKYKQKTKHFHARETLNLLTCPDRNTNKKFKKKTKKLCLSFVTCNLSHVTCHLSPVTCHLSPVTCHLSLVTCHLSPVTCHLSPVTCHLSPVTCLTYFLSNVSKECINVKASKGLVP